MPARGRSKESEKDQLAAEAGPNQPAEDRGATLAHAQQSPTTATGKEIARLRDQELEIDEKWESEIEGNPQPDFAAGPANAPEGAQAEPANFATNGTVAVNMVPSGSGPVPLGIAGQAGFPAAPDRKPEELLAGTSYQTADDLDEELIGSMSGADLRAAAHDRGIDIGMGGTRTSRRRFLRAQREAAAAKEQQ